MDFIGDPFRPLEPYILAAAFALARMLAVMTVFPVFDRLGVTGFIRNTIAVVVSIPLIPMIAAHLGGEQLSLGLIAALLLKEVIVGLVVGLVLAVPLYAAEAAGDMLDLQRGSSSATLSDPLGATQANITGTLLALIIIALYFASGCFDLTLRAIYDSYGIWPVRRFLPLFSREAGGLLLSLLDTIVATGLMLVGPIVVVPAVGRPSIRAHRACRTVAATLLPLDDREEPRVLARARALRRLPDRLHEKQSRRLPRREAATRGHRAALIAFRKNPVMPNIARMERADMDAALATQPATPTLPARAALAVPDDRGGKSAKAWSRPLIAPSMGL